MEDFWKNLSDKAKTALEQAGVTYEELKGTASEKFAELSEKAEKLAAEGKEEAAEAAVESKRCASGWLPMKAARWASCPIKRKNCLEKPRKKWPK